MNDTEFEQRACTNPWNDDPEFLAEAYDNRERQSLLATLRAQDGLLKEALQAPVPADLKSRLLALPESEKQQPKTSTSNVIHPDFFNWKKMLPLAASLMLAVALIFNLLPSTNNQVLANDMLAHLHAELPFLDSSASFSRDELNQHLNNHGGHFIDNQAMSAMQASGVMECWIEKYQATHFHMVMPGKKGTISVIVTQGDPVDSKRSFKDERFDGVVLPTPEGNLVVAGEKGEEIISIANELLANIDW